MHRIAIAARFNLKEDAFVEVLLQLLVGVIDAELFKRIHLRPQLQVTISG